MNSVGLSVSTLLVAILSIQAGAAAAKGLFPVLGAVGATTLRIFLAAIILLSIWRPWRTPITRKELRAVTVYGISLALMNLSYYLSLARIPLGIAVALEFTGPLAVAIFNSRKPIDFVWAFLAVVGLILVLPLSSSSTRLDPLGMTYALVGGLFWAMYIIFGQRAGATLTGGRATSLGMTVAALVILPIGLFQSGHSLFQPSILPLALLVAVLSSALPYSLEMISLKNLPAKTFGILLSLEPAVAALAGLIFLGENLSLLQWLAVLSVMTASFGSALTAKRQRE